MTDRVDLPKLADLPIPEDVKVGRGWTPFMVEMADHIGAHATLRLLDRFGGEGVYFTVDPAKSKFRDVVGEENAAILSHVYGGSRLELPKGDLPIARARRGPILAAVRQDRLTGDDAARILNVRRSSLRKMLRETDEGIGVPAAKMTGRKVDTRQMDMFGED